MSCFRIVWRAGLVCGFAGLAGELVAESSPPPRLTWSLTAGGLQLKFPPAPGVAAFVIESSSDVTGGYQADPHGTVEGYTWTAGSAAAPRFYRLRQEPVDAAHLLGSVALNRLAYGPTPDLIERVLTGPDAIGPEAYLAEQLAPETIDESDLDAPLPELGWERVVWTGIATSSRLYIYPSAPGEVYLDDLELVAGDTPGGGPNLIRNGDFESPLETAWTISDNLADTTRSATIKHSGAYGLHLVATQGGTTRGSSVWQEITPRLVRGGTYTVSYWYLPTTEGRNLTVRLSGAGSRPGDGIDTTHSLVPTRYLPGALREKLEAGEAVIDDLRAWFLLHAVRSERQLLQTLLQFWDNHFTTWYTKSRDWVRRRVEESQTARRVATHFEFRELQRWTEVLLNPNGTFYDLLRISAESPAMIIYLDTVSSRAGRANENYARELLELFTMGVDNGYTQDDIEELSRVWTGWRVAKLPPEQADNPLAEPVEDPDTDPGVWAFWFRSSRHDTGGKLLFPGRTVDARFGPPHAGEPYQLVIPRRSGDAGIRDGYDVLAHLANLPYTQEFISVKLCRLFVHENFHHGVHDYTDPDLSPEGRLIKECMAAWDRPGPDGRRGNLRQVLAVIFASDLFRGHAASRQKVRTPLEFVVATVRQLRAARPEGGYTADTDGYDLAGPLERMNMELFEREDPDGWPELGRDWISTASLVERMRFTQNFLLPDRAPLKREDYGRSGVNNVSDPVALLQQRLPAEQWNDADAVAAFFLDLLFLGEGRANLDLDRRAAVDFLNADATGAPDSSPFADLSADGAAYDERVRSLLAFLLALPRNHEQ